MLRRLVKELNVTGTIEGRSKRVIREALRQAEHFGAIPSDVDSILEDVAKEFDGNSSLVKFANGVLGQMKEPPYNVAGLKKAIRGHTRWILLHPAADRKDLISLLATIYGLEICEQMRLVGLMKSDGVRRALQIAAQVA